ncbi:MAG TPA: hypothetical protein VMX17_04765, partial [Candidatus Glassbacteria bacterium]|nr:hypothetical protein [Candidatus Glassbacteria bacterium]
NCGRTYPEYVRYCNDCGRKVDGNVVRQYKKEFKEYCESHNIDIEEAFKYIYESYFDNGVMFLSKNAVQCEDSGDLYVGIGDLYVGIIVCESESHRGSSGGQAASLSIDYLVKAEEMLFSFLKEIGFEKFDIKMYLITFISV